jgi:hypothetical protein
MQAFMQNSARQTRNISRNFFIWGVANVDHEKHLITLVNQNHHKEPPYYLINNQKTKKWEIR